MLPGGVRRQWGGAVERILGHGQQRSSEILFVALQSSVATCNVEQESSKSLRRQRSSRLASEGREGGGRGRAIGRRLGCSCTELENELVGVSRRLS